MYMSKLYAINVSLRAPHLYMCGSFAWFVLMHFAVHDVVVIELNTYASGFIPCIGYILGTKDNVTQ